MINVGVLYPIFLAVAIAGIYWYFQITRARLLIQVLTRELAGINNTNPWKSQLMLMVKSGQQVATSPAVTKGSMLYGALIIEEAAETIIGLAKGIEEVSMGRGSDLYNVAVDYTHIAKVMQSTSSMLRMRLARTNELPIERMISKEVAREILDGVTDLHVVTSGLGIACGLPGQAGYDRVATSNLSKANPVSGIIDKDPSGKWIKGSNYQEPDLDSLLNPYYQVAGQ